MLQRPWPSFLDLLDKNPTEAFNAFYSFARQVLRVKPPRPLQELSGDEAEDMIQNIILHCVHDNFRVLRQYRDQGKPFAAWLYVLAHNKCLDRLRGVRREAELTSHSIDPDGVDSAGSRPDPDIGPDERARLRIVIDAVRKCMSKLGDYCKLLLECAADEYTPSEMALLLGWSKDKNKKVSDDLRECRRRLKKMLTAQGVDMTLASYTNAR